MTNFMNPEENSEKDVVTWKLLQEAKNYRIGDGNTRLVGDEPEYGKSALEKLSLTEALEQFGENLRNIQGILGVVKATINQREYHAPPDPKAEARKRSREDVERKRRELRRKR